MPGKSESGGGLKTKKYVMQMGTHSEDSDTTFKAKDQGVINAAPLGRRAAANLSRNKALAKANSSTSSSTGSYGFAKGKGNVRGIQRQGGIKPVPSTGDVSKSESKGQSMENLFKSLGPVKTKSTAPPPKKQTKTVKPVTKPIAAPKSKPVSTSAPKPTASTPIPTPKATVATAPAKTPKAKESKPNAKKADKNFSKMVKLRTKANIISGDDSMSDKKKQRKLGRLRNRYDRQAAKHKQNRPSIGDAYKVNL
jgi:hypothetical protein